MRKYYIEYWTLGDTNRNVIAATFHHSNIKAFIRKLIAPKKFFVVHLEMVEPFRKVIYTNKTTQSDVVRGG